MAMVCLWLLIAPFAAAQQRTMLVGSGGSIEAMLFEDWTRQFNRESSSIQVTYFTTKSSDGLRAMESNAGDFGAGEIPISAKESPRSHTRRAEIPVALISVVVIFNLPGAPPLRFTGDLLAEIYMGHILRWNDTHIAALNPGALLPDLPITLISRPRGSGTRYLFTEFLCGASGAFCQWSKDEHSRVRGEVEIAGGNGVATKLAETSGAIAYVNAALASRNGLATASIRNSAGSFVKAGRTTITAAYAARRAAISQDSEASLVDAPGELSYPIIGFAWVYLPTTGLKVKREPGLHKFLTWCLGKGQTLIGSDFIPLPEELAVRARAELDAALAPEP